MDGSSRRLSARRETPLQVECIISQAEWFTSQAEWFISQAEWLASQVEWLVSQAEHKTASGALTSADNEKGRLDWTKDPSKRP